MANNEPGGNLESDNNIQVFVRIRPPSADEPAYSRVVDVDATQTQVVLQQDPSPRVFAFDFVADIDSTQESIFHNLGRKVIENCMKGYNGTIFAYGQTGSGKTFTMLGPSEDADTFQSEHRGVIPRSFEHLYNLVAREKELHGESKEFLIKCSFLEIYNEQIYDLLEPSSANLQLRESIKTGVYVAGLSEQVVSNASEAFHVLCSSWVNRKVASTSMNRESSRSHAVFTLQIESKEKKGPVEHIRTSQLHLVDLAGSERQKDTGAVGLRLKEASSINKSLSNLGNVIMTLVNVSRDGRKRYIPYRDSKLTFLLRDSLGGNAKTSLIACVHPGHRCYGETLSTLQFAKRAKMIKNKAVLNENSLGNIKQLQAEIRCLKDELAKYRSGSVPQQVSSTAHADMPELRKMFLQAMLMIQRTDLEKQDLEVCVLKLKEVIDKKDKAMQTNKMIIKFRNNNIRQLEDKLKGLDVQLNNKDEIQQELESLRHLVEHHPQLARNAVEIKTLKSTISRLREEPRAIEAVCADVEAIRALETLYKQLLADQPQQTNELTPQRADMVSTATLEKLKSQNADLESKLEQVRHDHDEMKQAAEKREAHLKNELDSAQSTVKELEVLLSANNMRTKLEKAAINEQHRQQVKTILTPKKDIYRLRNRTVSKASGDLDMSIPFLTPTKDGHGGAPQEDEGIMGEEMGDVFMQGESETLLDQIKELQEQVSDMTGRINEYETDRVKQQQKLAFVESELRTSQQYVEEEKKTVAGLREELRLSEPKLREALEERDAARGENFDLKLMLSQTDREIKEHRLKNKSMEADQTKQMDAVMTKIGECDRVIETMERMNSCLEEEKSKLEVSLETELETRQFYQNRCTENDSLIEDMKGEIVKLQTQVQDLDGQLGQERADRETLISELRSEGKEKEKEVCDWMDEVKNVRRDLDITRNMLEASKSTNEKLRGVVTERDDRIRQLEAESKHTEVKISQLYERIEVSELAASELQQSSETKQEEVVFYQRTVEELSVTKQQLENDLSQLREQTDAELKIAKAECEMLSEDLTAQTQLGEQLQEQLNTMEKEKSSLQHELQQLQSKLEENEAALSNAQGSMDTQLQQLSNDVTYLTVSLQDKQKEISTLKSMNEELAKTNSDMSDLQARLESQTEELSCTRERLAAEEQRAREFEQAAVTTQQTLDTMTTKLQETSERCQQLEDNHTRLEETVQRLQDLASKDQQEKQELTDKNSAIEKELQHFREGLGKINAGLGLEDAAFLNFDDVVTQFKTLSDTKEEYHNLLVQCSGHNNKNQKIHVMQIYKNKMAAFETENSALRLKNSHLENELRKTKEKPSFHREALKENLVPGKTFFSGEFQYK